MTNDRITSSQGYKQIVKKALEDKPLSLGGGKKKRHRQSKNALDTVSGKALTYLETNIRPIMQIQQWDTRIKEEDIIKKLKDKNIIKDKTELTKRFISRMNAVIFRHNANIYKKEFTKYKQSKNSYQMTVHAIVWDEQNK